MITTGIILIFFWFTDALISALPAGVNFSETIHTSASTLGSYAQLVNGILPVLELFYVIVTVTAIEIGLQTFRIILWIIHLVRGGGHPNTK